VADLSIKINADFDKASDQFKKLGEESQFTADKIEKFSKSFKEEGVKQFIDKQNLLAVAVGSTQGELASLTTQQGAYKKEIERLIKSGLDPNSEAIETLRDKYTELSVKIEETNRIQEMQIKLTKAAQTAAVACYAAIGAGIAAIGAMTQKTAEMGDQYAKTARTVGMTAETFQELDYAAKQSGVKDITSHLKKLNTTVADVKSGTGTLTKYLKDNDKQLLSQIQNVNSNEEAFSLMMDAIKRAPDEFTRAQLATAAFGRSGQELVRMAEKGSIGIAELREEARKYGVISDESARQSELYMEAQTRLKTALTGVQTELTSKLLPGMTDVISKVADFIANFDDWERVITIAGYALAGLTAGLTAFLIITKGAAAIQVVVTAFKALNAAIAANPIGAIAVVITAVLIPALIYLYRNWDMVQTYLSQGIARLEYAFKWLGSVIKEKLLVAFAVIKAAGATLVDFIYGNIIRGIGKMIELMGVLPFVGEKFKTAAQAVSGLGNAIGDVATEARNSIGETMEAAKAEQKATEETLKAKLAATDAAALARREELNTKKQESDEEVALIKEKADAELAILQEAADKKANLKDEEVKKDKWAAMSAEDLLQLRLQGLATFFSGYAELFGEFANDIREFAIFQKGLAAAEALINSYAAFTRALNDFPQPYSYIAAAGVLASGLAK